jgi:hypothetical protein
MDGPKQKDSNCDKSVNQSAIYKLLVECSLTDQRTELLFSKCSGEYKRSPERAWVNIHPPVYSSGLYREPDEGPVGGSDACNPCHKQLKAGPGRRGS